MDNRFIPIKDHPDLVRDTKTNAVLNINKNKHRTNVRMLEAKRQEREEIEQLKSDVSDIKFMLQKLLENGTNG